MAARRVFTGRRVVFDGGEVAPAAVVVEGGCIVSVTPGYNPHPTGYTADQVVDAGDLVLMPGVVDSHVHVNEPGRTDWEGFETATRAAAAGGITTIVDMPLNSIPPTTSVENLKTKKLSATGKCHIDVGFWGGVVPGNQAELRPMLAEGVCGFKCFMINSGVEEFVSVTTADIRLALQQLQGTKGVFLFHAENEIGVTASGEGDPRLYSTFLKSRPDAMELSAIETVCRLSKEYGVHCHIVHLSTAHALDLLKDARQTGTPITVETTHHYLTLAAETVPEGATQFKCCPPIRSQQNQVSLWDGLERGVIDIVVSDHSPCTPDLKLLDEGDFMRAWGGIASVQLGLSLFWTGCRGRGWGVGRAASHLSAGPAKVCGLTAKGRLQPGCHADLVIWDPEESFQVTQDMIHHKNKVTPYLGMTLYGRVHKTFLRGELVYNEGEFAATPRGQFVGPV